MVANLQRWRGHVRERPGRDPERELSRLQRRFAAVSNRYDRAVARRAALRRVATGARRWGKVLAVAGGIALVAWGAMLVLSPWPPLATLRHVAAAPNCDAARLVRLAPSHRGAPGYWPDHDADGDGIACEPVPAWKLI